MCEAVLAVSVRQLAQPSFEKPSLRFLLCEVERLCEERHSSWLPLASSPVPLA